VFIALAYHPASTDASGKGNVGDNPTSSVPLHALVGQHAFKTGDWAVFYEIDSD